MPPLKLLLKPLRTLPFRCQSSDCPKVKDIYNVVMLKRAIYPVDTNFFQAYGCAGYKTQVFGAWTETCSQDQWDQAPLIGVILPAPDPSGAQGTCGGLGMGRDVIAEALVREFKQPLRIAFLLLTRGYSFNKVAKGDFVHSPVKKAAVANCHPYLLRDLAELKPSRLLLCGQEVGDALLHGSFDVPTFRRKTALSVEIGGTHYPAQVTYAPYLCASLPVYIQSIREDCGKLAGKHYQIHAGTHRLLRTLDEALDYLDFLSEWDGYISVDTETENLNRKAKNKLGTIQFSTDTDLGVVLPYQHRETPFDAYELAILKKRLALLFGKKIKAAGWIIHNAKFEHTVFKNHFGTFIDSAPVFDTQAMAFLQDETRSERKMDVPKGTRGIYSLKALSRDYLGWYGYDKGALIAREAGTLIDLPLDDLARYGSMDTWITLQLFYRIQDLAHEQGYLKQLMKLTEHYYGPASRLVALIEMTGFKTDLKYLRKLAARKGPIETKIKALELKMQAMPAFKEANLIAVRRKNAGHTMGVLGNVPWMFDFSKDEDKKNLFFQVLGLDPVSYSEKTGLPSIDEEFFTEYQDEYPEVAAYAEYSEAKKMRDTFITKILERIDPETGDPDCRMDQRIRSNIWYARLVTGRWAMTDPNCQQLPKSEEGGDEDDFLVRKAVKDIFTVDPGHALIQIDYKVNEVRWAGILAKDEALAKIFNEADALLREARISEDPAQLQAAAFKEDIHRNTAAETFGKALEEVSKSERSASKAITFGIMFQSSAKSIANSLAIRLEEAENYIAKFFSRMFGVDRFIKWVKEFANQNGFVETPIGRRRRFWGFELPLTYQGRRSHVARNERQSVNAPIQGVASDGSMLGGACSLMDYIDANKKNWLIQNVVHDSVLVQVPLNEVAEIILIAEPIFVEQAMRRMEKLGVEFNLPLAVDVELGFRWGSLRRWNGTKTHAYKLQAEMQAEYEKVAALA